MPESVSSSFRELFRTEVSRPEAELDLPRCALYLAGEEFPSLDVADYLGRMDDMAAEVTHLAGADSPSAHRTRTLNHYLFYLFDRQKFTGNPQDYYNPDNSFLNRVMDTGTGIPITLSVLYLGVAGRLGLNCRGVGLPGHFLVELQDLGLYLDPFHSGPLASAADCRRLAQDMFGPAFLWQDSFLAPATGKLILYRMLNNLRQIYLAGRDYPRHVAAVERMLFIEPDASPLYLELARSQVQLGDTEAALLSLETFSSRARSERELTAARELINILHRKQTNSN